MRWRRLLLSSSSLLLLSVVGRTYGRADWSGDRECLVLLDERVECGRLGTTEQECRQCGCCWMPTSRLGVPWCHRRHLTRPRYHVVGIEEEGGKNQYELFYPGAEHDRRAAARLGVSINYQPDTVHLRIQGKRPTGVPEELYKAYPGYPMPAIHWESRPMIESQLEVLVKHNPFQFAILRRSDQTVLFDTEARNSHDPFDSIVVKAQYVEVGTRLPRNHYIFGLGERAGPFRKAPGRMAFHGHDTPAFEGCGLYGAHLFYLDLRAGGIAHGVLMLNSHPTEVELTEDSLVYRMLGGRVDLYVFAGPTPDNVIEQYTRLIGRPPLIGPSFLGLHQCRFGYRTLAEWKQVVEGYEKEHLPLDGVWLDIDYMDDEHNVGSVSKDRYPPAKLKAFIQDQHEKGRVIVPIVDPGISVKPGWPPYVKGLKDKVFLISPDNANQPYTGTVWPGPVHFVDFYSKSSQRYWKWLLSNLLKQVPGDGLWIDMNEPAEFDRDPALDPPNPGPHQHSLNYPPFAINAGGAELDLFRKTIRMDVRDAYGPHLNNHNTYGFAESMRTALALRKLLPKQRPFILSRSTFPGSGRFAAHWLGDNYSDFDNMRLSIAGIMDFQLFGIPMVGADICGFHGTADEELCAWWMALGAFYPFARNHNAQQPANIPQEPFRWPKVAAVTRKYYGLRYSLLPYWYTLLRQSHETGKPVIRPMFFEFPSLESMWAMDRQFMLGPAILVVPVLSRGARTVPATFPPAIWYDLDNLDALPLRVQEMPRTIEMDVSDYRLPVFLRGGSILLRQIPGLTIKATMENHFWLLVALDENQSAQGTAYFDDGVSPEPGEHHTKLQFSVSCSAKRCILETTGHFGYPVLPRVRQIIILSPNAWNSFIEHGRGSGSLLGPAGPPMTVINYYRIDVNNLDLSLNEPYQKTIPFSSVTKAGSSFFHSSY